jgi:hypothetical protein
MTIVVDLLKESNPNCFILTGRPRTPRDQGSIESANKIVQQILKSISLENCLRSMKENWTKILGQVMAVCNSHSGRRKHSLSSYEAVFGQKYHPQLKSNMSEMRECRSIFQRLKMSPDERLEACVQQHNIVDIEFDHAEYDEYDNVDDSDEDEGVDIDENAFSELNLEENNVQLVNQSSDDGLGDTRMHDDDRDDNSINEVLVVDPPPIVVDPPPVYCQITSDSPPPVDKEPTEPTMFCVREYSTFTAQEVWDHGNIAQYHQPLVGTCDEFQFLWPMLTCRDYCFPHGAPYIQIGDDDYISSMTNRTNWYYGVFISLFAQLAAHYAHITYDERHSTLCQ